MERDFEWTPAIKQEVWDDIEEQLKSCKSLSDVERVVSQYQKKVPKKSVRPYGRPGPSLITTYLSDDPALLGEEIVREYQRHLPQRDIEDWGILPYKFYTCEALLSPKHPGLQQGLHLLTARAYHEIINRIEERIKKLEDYPEEQEVEKRILRAIEKDMDTCEMLFYPPSYLRWHDSLIITPEEFQLGLHLYQGRDPESIGIKTEEAERFRESIENIERDLFNKMIYKQKGRDKEVDRTIALANMLCGRVRGRSLEGYIAHQRLSEQLQPPIDLRSFEKKQLPEIREKYLDDLTAIADRFGDRIWEEAEKIKDSIGINERYRRIFDEVYFQGKSVPDLAKEMKVCRQRIYQILDYARDAFIKAAESGREERMKEWIEFLFE